MAALQDILSDFNGELNRDDCSQVQAINFVNRGLARIQRSLRVPSMERHRLILAQGQMTYATMPDDFLEMIDVFASLSCQDRSRALERRAFRQIVGLPNQINPEAYARIGSTIHFRGAIPQGGSVLFHYYGAVSSLSNLTDTNEFTLACPDLVTYAALKYAGLWCDHPSTQTWEDTFTGLLGDVQGQAIAMESSGGPASIQPLYITE
ncbi:hypothetical protein C0V97_12440 [Asaia sp. W19]|uniref:phage adaptor protein n=1 Tax=unclassified Asaia TaxID=2685023 RepID=UPI000F8E27BD|nr:hypothetical protein [Asaia sp. W19]RUT24198.1 hypothetical protein C0V97_17870 [Asaia sp. W19]RUT25384.1 hypothetical protein C0V97_12440 [Asaia sp. W19]